MIWFMPSTGEASTGLSRAALSRQARLTWWRGKSADDKRLGRYSIYDDTYHLITYVRPGNGLSGDMHEFKITSRNTALMTLSHRVRVKTRNVLEGAFRRSTSAPGASCSSGTASATSG
jgi:hypothetical protein